MKKLFSLFALVGAFVACQPEELETAFTVDPAKATINVTVFDVQTAEPIEGLEVTFPDGEGEVDGNVVTINGNLVAIDGNVVTISGTPAKPAIQAMDVKLILSSSKYPDESKEVSVKVNSLLAGGVATYNVVEVLGTPYPEPGPDPEPEPVEITVERGEPVSITETAYLSTLDVEGHSHSHNGIDLTKWAENPTPFMITVSGTYSVYSGVKAEKTSVLDPEYESLVDTYVTAYNVGQKEEQDEFSFPVSAWSLYTVWQTKTTDTTEYVVKVDGETVGTFDVEGVSSTQVEYLEMALPGHSHDYVHGHGHASHGEHDNSGGGIYFAE